MGQEVRALKKISLKGQNVEKTKKEVVTDIEITKKLSHPNVIKNYEFYRDKDFIYIVSQFYEGGEMLDHLEKSNFLLEAEAQQVIRQVLEVISYAHSQGVTHRDIKLQNILLKKKVEIGDSNPYEIAVIDWGCSCTFDRTKKLTEFIGTLIYMAPEVFQRKYDEKADIWSIGVLTYILLTGEPPFYG